MIERRMCLRMTRKGLRVSKRGLLQATNITNQFLSLTVLLCSAGTSHIIAADHSGLVISAITTVNTLFGSKVMVPETGVVMNNEMDGMRRTPLFTPRNSSNKTRFLYSSYVQ